MSEDSMLIRISEDRSFLYLAELILDSDLVPSLLEFVEQRTNTHSGICSIFGISSYISRNMPIIMSQILLDHDTIYLVRFMEDRFTLWINFFRFLVNASRRDTRILARKTRGKILQILESSCNVGKMIFYSRMFVEYEDDEKDNLLAAWKLSDRGQDIDVHVRVVPIGTRILGVNRYPSAEINTYHFSRAASKLGGLVVPQLSFLSRPLGAISSGGNKALETLIATGVYWLLVGVRGYMYCTAEGSGSILAVLGLAFPLLQIIYNTWMRDDVCGRDNATDTSVPAWVDLRQDSSRLVTPNPLIIGQTDITHPEFMNKILKMISEYPPTLVTMDAESSVSTNNLHFLKITIVPIAEKCDCFFLVKLFHMCDLTERINETLSSIRTKYMWVLHKPISSNPVGCEIYLVIIPIGKRTKEFDDCLQMQSYYTSYIHNSMNMNLRSTHLYTDISSDICNLLRSIFPSGQLDIPHTYIPQEGSLFCNLFCPRFLDEHMMTIDTLHLSDDNLAAGLATRSKGVNNVLYQFCHDLVFLFLYHTYHSSLYLKFYNLSICQINKDIETCRKERTGYTAYTSPGKGDMWGTWRDARMFMREYGKLTNPCNCNPMVREWTWDPISRFNPTNSISWQIFSCLERMNLVHWNTYLSYRVERKEMSSRVSYNRFCNVPQPRQHRGEYVELREPTDDEGDEW